MIWLTTPAARASTPFSSPKINKINDVLGQMIPLIIGFLAGAIGLGGIGQKIREIITKLQKPVNAALDFVIKRGLQLAGPVIRGLKGIGSRAKAKIAPGRAWVKGKAAAARDRLVGAGSPRPTRRTRSGARRRRPCACVSSTSRPWLREPPS